MTDAQNNAIKQLRDIVREHFDASVIIVQGDAVDVPDPDKVVDIEYIFHGGYASSIGLLELAKIHVWKRGVEESEVQ